MSKSVLLYEPTIEDDGRYLTCRAENAALRNTALEDQWTIQVHCKQLYCFYKGKSFKLIRCIADFDATLYTCVWGLAVLPTCLIAIFKTSFGLNLKYVTAARRGGLTSKIFHTQNLSIFSQHMQGAIQK